MRPRRAAAARGSRTGSGNRPSARHRPGGGGSDAEQHHQRVAIDIAGLEPGGELRAAHDRGGEAVRAEAVDRALVAALPEEAADPHGGTDEDEIVELVEIPFV